MINNNTVRDWPHLQGTQHTTQEGSANLENLFPSGTVQPGVTENGLLVRLRRQLYGRTATANCYLYLISVKVADFVLL